MLIPLRLRGNLLRNFMEEAECYVLCVNHWGVSWDLVEIEVNKEND